MRRSGVGRGRSDGEPSCPASRGRAIRRIGVTCPYRPVPGLAAATIYPWTNDTGRWLVNCGSSWQVPMVGTWSKQVRPVASDVES